jgi:hypothetical protein
MSQKPERFLITKARSLPAIILLGYENGEKEKKALFRAFPLSCFRDWDWVFSLFSVTRVPH